MKQKYKIIFALLLISSHLEAIANCAKAPDPKKVILFIDTNESEMEIDVAQKSACVRGETLVVVPRNYKEYSQLTKKRADLMKRQRACRDTDSNCQSSVAKEIEKVNIDTGNLQKGNSDYSNLVEKELTLMRQQGAKLKNVTISGHDGGGRFGGLKGGFTRSQLAKTLESFGDVNEVQSLHLLGCYTGVKNEVINWSLLFPDLRLIGGYDGAAPTSEKPAGHNYLKDLLEKEKSLISETDEKKIVSHLKSNLKSLNLLYAGVYVRPLCQKNEIDEGYLYETLGGVKISKINNPIECMKNRESLKNLAKTIDLYNSGEKEPPLNSSSGEMRTLYNEMRKNEHCPNLGISPMVTFGLLFHDGMKKSFAAYFQKDLEKMESQINNFSEDDRKKMIDGNLEMIRANDESIKYYQRIADLADKDPALLKKEKQKEKEILIAEYNKLLENPEVKKFAAEKKLSSLTNNSETPMRMDLHSLVAKTEEVVSFITKHYKISAEINPILRDLEKGKAQDIKKNYEMYVESNKTIRDQINTDLSKVISVEEVKKLWIPTEKNLKTKTRKEIMLNAHYLNEVLSTKIVPLELAMPLYGLNSKMQKHLILLDNPFSWHEYTGGVVEAPSASFGIYGSMGSLGY